MGFIVKKNCRWPRGRIFYAPGAQCARVILRKVEKVMTQWEQFVEKRAGRPVICFSRRELENDYDAAFKFMLELGSKNGLSTV